MVELEAVVRSGAIVSGAQDCLVVGAGGDCDIERRSRVGLPGGGGPERVCEVSVGVQMRDTKELGLDGASLLVWTTTPWTLPSNQFAAVHPELEYSVVADDNDATGTTEKLIVASALVETLAEKVKRELKVEKKILGSKLVGLRYVPPFDFYYRIVW